ncbi:MAG: L-sorbosone dehydrogenase [Planctomycetota bacterium]
MVTVAFITVFVAVSDARATAQGLGVTPPDQFSVADGFEVELVHAVDEATQGSWVSLTVDPKGRLITCDQYGGLFRIDLTQTPAAVEKLDIDFVGAQGLLCAFDSLYANVNARGEKNGLWRLTDTNGDDQYDTKEHLIPLNGGSEHGPHGVIPTPDGKRLLMVAGNNTNLPEENEFTSRVPQVWDEDHLLGRMPDARGHNASRMAPGGFILELDPDGSNIEVICTGFRNPYDIALNRDGQLFTYDADMEWDVGTPWYRPTRINHVISGAEFGWRNGTGKWPSYYPDSFDAAVDIGPGSPTGICFGYGAKFPAKYENALFICDWSYGNIHAVFLEEDGSSYTGRYETFATAAPLPVTDLTVHPDGNLYVAIGGRRTQSALYRIKYTGDVDDKVAQANPVAAKARTIRQELEQYHVADDALPVGVSVVVEQALEQLGSDDRATAFAARIALEHRDLAAYQDQVLSADTQRLILGSLAIARHGSAEDQAGLWSALGGVDFSALSPEHRTAYLRAVGLTAMRLGEPTAEQRQSVINNVAAAFPSGNDSVDRELALMLVYLGHGPATEQIVAKLESAPSQESQIHYAMTLRGASQGWTRDLRTSYLKWFNDIQSARGGMSFGGFINNIRKAAIESMPESETTALAGLLEAPKASEADAAPARPMVKQWTVDELVASVSQHAGTPDFDNGKAMFAAASCYKCHRMGVQGGILGPDLTSAGGKYSIRDMLVSIVEPSKEISDQYGATQFLTEDGDVIVGRVVNMSGKQLRVMTNMLDPSSIRPVNRDEVMETSPSRLSMMPTGLLDTLTKEDIADLIAYLRAGGRETHPIYGKTVASK